MQEVCGALKELKVWRSQEFSLLFFLIKLPLLSNLLSVDNIRDTS